LEADEELMVHIYSGSRPAGDSLQVPKITQTRILWVSKSTLTRIVSLVIHHYK